MTGKPLTLQWNQLILDAIKLTKTSPPLAARALAMLHTAMYDAWSVYSECAISTVTAQYIKILDRYQCTKDNKHKAFSYAAYRVLTGLFCFVLPAENKNMFRDFMCASNYDPDDNTLDITKAQGIGNLMAALTIERHNGDGTNAHGTLHDPQWSDYTGYKPVNTPGHVNDLSHWQPLLTETAPGEFKTQNFLVPHWGLVKPFAMQYNWQLRPEKPFSKNDPGFKEQAEEVRKISERLTSEQKAIAEYWGDGPGTYTPPGHWFEIAQFIADKYKYGNTDCIKLFFALANAMLDASVACWECKHHYDAVRPVTAIRELYKGKDIRAWGGPHKGTQTIKAENWTPYISTPAFPEYVSGHSTFSRAAAVILKTYTGSDDFGGCSSIEKGSSKTEPGTVPDTAVMLDWPTFTIAAEQAGMSRLYGGIHFMRGNQCGQNLGEAVGLQVWEKAKFYFNG